MRRETLGFGPFLHRLEQCLAERSADELRTILLNHAKQLPAAEREGFLDIFEQPSTTLASAGDDGLVDDIEAFIADVKKGVYVDGWGYDPDYGEHRAFGDETWAIEFDTLAERAGMALVAGGASTAREAYRRLLLALDDEYDEGGFPGAGTPQELVATDMDEAKHRYLRAVWEDEPVPTRAAAWIAAAEEVTYIGGRTRLAKVEATRREPLPDPDDVLSDLIEVLRQVPRGFGFGTDARQLLAEATERHGGVDCLAVLARTPGPQQAEVYRDWVDALVRAGRLSDARVAAAEALDQLAPHGVTVAAVAERLTFLAAAHADDSAVLAGRTAAWRADPTLTRLLELVDVATALTCQAEVIATEADRTADEPLARQPALTAAILLLAGRVGHATQLLESGNSGWWDAGAQPAAVVLPFLLVGASNAHHDQRWANSLLHELLDRANCVGWRYGSHDSNDDVAETLSGAVPTPLSRRGTAAPRDRLLLSSLLTEDLDRRPPAPDERERWLQMARHHVDAQVDLVVGGKHRSSYARMAHLAAACAEVLMLAANPAVAHHYRDDLHARYPRHTSFRRELRAIVRQSPLLSDRPRPDSRV
ncbi:MAG: hypothetical protein ACRDQA_01045 [Nocardioidaceae bacterium]